MSRSAANLVCLRHPKYDGVESPDLNCKVCCSKFVDRIRAEQSKLFEVNVKLTNAMNKDEFTPLKAPILDQSASKRHANFDGSWI